MKYTLLIALLLITGGAGLICRIFVVPVMTPKISSYGLYFVTATSISLAKKLVNSMKTEVACKPTKLAGMLERVGYDTAIQHLPPIFVTGCLS